MDAISNQAEPAVKPSTGKDVPVLAPVILAGGIGTRLWPLSRQLRPKQFLSFGGETTMLQQTVARLSGVECTPPLIVCNEEHRFLAAEQLRQIGREDATLLLEPASRSTAPALACATLTLMRDHDDPIIAALAADHLIVDTAEFHRALADAVELARHGNLVTFGIVPKWPETGYGYIEQGEAIGNARRVARFVEKPDIATAETYLTDGNYLWNSGMFVFRASRLLEELQTYRPDIHEACLAATADPTVDMGFMRLDAEAFSRCPEESVDCAVMEKTKDAVVVPLDAGWNDVGSWSALWDVCEKDSAGNVIDGDIVALETSDTLMLAESRLVVALGVSDLVIVETKDAVLVAHKDSVENVKDVVGRLRSAGRTEPINHRVVYRPWGHYDSIDVGDRDQVKRITVKPGAKLSLQKHYHRSEHWIVVRGTAKVYKGDKIILLSENESTYIALGEVHALENPGKIPLELIEVQTGSYLGEDDIVRLDDRYGRN